MYTYRRICTVLTTAGPVYIWSTTSAMAHPQGGGVAAALQSLPKRNIKSDFAVTMKATKGPRD